MRGSRTLVLTAAIAAAAVACGDTGEDEVDTEAALPEESYVEQQEPDLAAGGAALAVDSMGPGNLYLTDAQGRALYVIEGAPADSSICYDACAAEWPPFLAPQGSPTAQAPAVQSGLVGTIQRRGGETQVTYDGQALYYYHDDTGPGMTTGQDVTDQWGEWYLLRPNGEVLEQGG